MIAEILSKKLQEEQAVKRERSGLWSPSSFGRCYRYQIWNRMGVEQTNPPGDNALRKFRIGNMFHRDLQGLIPPEQVEVEFTHEDIHGFADWVSDSFVCDFKTVGQFEWRIISKEGYNPEKDKIPNMLQLMTYCMVFNKPQGILCCIEKDSYQMREFVVKYDEWKDKLQEELEVIRSYWKDETVPAPEPRAYGGKECQYCSFQSKCKANG